MVPERLDDHHPPLPAQYQCDDRVTETMGPPTTEVNDQNIMDDVQCRLPHADQLAINNVRLYLQVFFLSEITNANGITILSHVVNNGPRQSGSTLQWPRQPIPPPEAWKHWKRAIQGLYLKTNSNHLITPLKEWTENANMAWNWEWRIDPTTMILYQWNGR